MRAWFRSTVMAIVLAAAAGLAGPASATLVLQPFGGTIDAVIANPFGLTDSDVITGHAIYNDALVPGTGGFNLAIDSNPNFDLVVVWGEDVLVFGASDDIGFGGGFPQLNFLDGALVDIDFATDVAGFPALVHGTDGVVDPADPQITIFDTDAGEALIDGTLVFDGVPEPVPAPGGLAAMLVGLAALRLWRRRR